MPIPLSIFRDFSRYTTSIERRPARPLLDFVQFQVSNSIYANSATLQTTPFKRCSFYTTRTAESRVSGLSWAKDITHLRITTLGRYHVNQLIRTFLYVDAVVIDTPILDARIRGTIEDVRDIFERVQRAREFVEYLSTCAKSLQDGDSFRLWSDTYNDLQKSINGVYANAKRWETQRGRS